MTKKLLSGTLTVFLAGCITLAAACTGAEESPESSFVPPVSSPGIQDTPSQNVVLIPDYEETFAADGSYEGSAEGSVEGSAEGWSETFDSLWDGEGGGSSGSSGSAGHSVQADRHFYRSVAFYGKEMKDIFVYGLFSSASSTSTDYTPVLVFDYDTATGALEGARIVLYYDTYVRPDGTVNAESKNAALIAAGEKLRGMPYSEEKFTIERGGYKEDVVAMVWSLDIPDLFDNTLNIHIENLAREITHIPQDIDGFLQQAFFDWAHYTTGIISKPIFADYGAKFETIDYECDMYLSDDYWSVETLNPFRNERLDTYGWSDNWKDYDFGSTSYNYKEGSSGGGAPDDSGGDTPGGSQTAAFSSEYFEYEENESGGVIITKFDNMRAFLDGKPDENYNVNLTIEIPSEIDGKPVTGIGDHAFYNSDTAVKVIIPDSVKTIGIGAFESAQRLEEIILPSGLESIGQAAFHLCFSLKQVAIPKSLKEFGDSAFCDTGIESVVFEDGLTLIGDRVFADCNKLKSVTIPSSVTSVGVAAFYSCESLESAIISEGLTSLSPSMFGYCKSLKSAQLPDGLITIGKNALESCESLESIDIPYTVTSIEDYAFAFSGLKSVVIPGGVTVITSGMLNSCKDLTSVTLPDGVTAIERNAFTACSSLPSITLPQTVKTVAYLAFSSCTNLTDVYIPSGASVQAGAFKDSPNVKITQG